MMSNMPSDAVRPSAKGDHPAASQASRAQELRLFLFLTVVLAPVLSIALVGGYGFLIWIYQMFAGPPGV